ncbi:phage tail length tape-measure protein 1 [Sulfuriferula multivorans]|uniref:Phage tail length tape-measure protein 1 n=1 Tax=Sulfuriferula multivorans TaxID=1559896 RepID=A0A401JF36_9PROT|nr:hypothetical protein [Sulfuriferula multivorans]GBL46214.1 phage tail length tape-measure protein 1 [Sulfuriferula multivorans]
MSGNIIFGIKITGDASSAKKAIEETRQAVDRQTGELRQKMGSAGKDIAATQAGLLNTARIKLPDPTAEMRTGISRTSEAVTALQSRLAAAFAVGAVITFVRNTTQEFSRAEAAYRGLEAVANSTGLGIAEAQKVVSRVTADGLVTVSDASKALQNLLSRGYDVSQAESTLNHLKDSAAFNRQASLSMSEAVLTATEGLKNENSILVDNAGVTKNVSVIWKEYADSIGKSVANLTTQEKIQAEVSGIMRETAAQAGNAAEAAKTLQGEQGRLDSSTKKLSASIGQTLVPVMKGLVVVGQFLIDNFFKPVVFFAGAMGIAVGRAAANTSAFFDLLKTRDFGAFTKQLAANKALAEQSLIDSAGKLSADTLSFTPRAPGPLRQPAATPPAKPDKKAAADAARAAKAAAKAQLDYQREAAIQAARLEQDEIKRSIDANQHAYDDKLISADQYYAALAALQQRQADNEIALLVKQRAVQVAIQTDPKAALADRIAAATQIAKINTDIALTERDLADQQAASLRARVLANAEAVKSAQDMVDALNQEAFALGLTDDERARAVALLELENLKVKLTADQYTKLGIALNSALDSKSAADARKKSLDDAKKQAEDIYSALTENLQRSIAEVLQNGFNGDGARGAVLGLVNIIKTSLSNVLAANITDTILSAFPKDSVVGLGGLLGLGGAKRGETALTPMYVQDVSAASGAAGLLKTGDAKGPVSSVFDAIGTKVGGIFDEFKTSTGSFFSEFFSGLKGGFGDLFNGIGSLFSSIFSSGSGSGSGSGIWGSIFNAAASYFSGGTSAAASYATGGYTGDGGTYQPKGIVHGGEYVFSKASVQRLGVGALDNLHRLAKGGMIPHGPRFSYAEGGMVNLPSAASPSPTINNNNSTKIVNVIDPSLVSGFLATSAGERAILNIIERNPGSIKQVIS